MSIKKMKVVALGGCGGMGMYAVRTALSFDFIDEIIIADLDYERTKTFSEKCGPKTKPVQVDVQDHEALLNLFKGSDVVMTTVGPFYRFGIPVLETAIKAGCHYIDICDDWEPTLKMLKLDQAAKQAGITAIIGMGASPGITNILAAKAKSCLDSVDDLITGWGDPDPNAEMDDAPDEGGGFGAAIEHWLVQITGQIKLFRNGKFEVASPIEEINIDYPGIGLRKGWTVGHPEPMTFAHYFDGIKNSSNVMCLSLQNIKVISWFASEIDKGRKSIKEVVGILTKSPKELEAAIPATVKAKLLLGMLKKDPKPYLPKLFAYAKGMKDGKNASAGVSLTRKISSGGIGKDDNMGALTGVPLALGLKMFAKGAVKKTGVLAPEAAFDPDIFFNELAPMCTPQCDNARDLLNIAVSF